MDIDAAAIGVAADALRASAEVLADCAARVGAIDFGSEYAGCAHGDAGRAVQEGFQRVGRALAACGAGAARSGAVLASNAAAVEARDRRFATQLRAAVQ